MSAEKGGSRLPPEAASLLHKKLDNPNASKKVHDYLQMQQRKKEDFWMRKFGRLIDPLPGKVGGSPPSRAGELPPLAMGMNASPRITNTELALLQAPGNGHRLGSVGAYLNVALPERAVAKASSPKALGAAARFDPPRAGLALVATPNRGGRPLKELQSELVVLKAIKAREEGVAKLALVVSKIEAAARGPVAIVNAMDPLGSLFYRLVGAVRTRTLEAVEAIAVWQRRAGGGDAFYYRGSDFLASLGYDLDFLERASFMRNRGMSVRVTEDPFLKELTPDGMPIEEATPFDFRRGGKNFTAEALRIRMARNLMSL